MATRLIFPSEEALRLALTSELVPTEVQATPALAGRDEDGSVTVEPGQSLTRAQLGALSEAGVKVTRGRDDNGLDPVRCWPEIVSPVRVGEGEIQTSMVLFALPTTDRLLPLAGELLRLGCDRQDFCYLQQGNGDSGGIPAHPERPAGARGTGIGVLLRAVKPPYYTLARALDRPQGLRAFVPTPPGQERVWTEMGYHHSLATSVHAPAGGVLLIAADRWHTLPAATWVSLYKLIDVELPSTSREHDRVSMPDAQRLQVTLQLRRLARETSPTLWVMDDAGVEQVDRLVQQLPQREISRLLFAVGGTRERPVVLLRAREGRGKPPVLELDESAQSHAPWLDINNLYLPADGILEPPLRRETLKNLLAPDPEQVTWLTPGDGPTTFALERIPDNAFAPLDEWVEYVVHSDAQELDPWIRAATFDFDAYESVGVEWSEGPAVEQRPAPRKEKKPERQRAPQPATSRAAEPLQEYEAEVEQAPRPVEEVLPVLELSRGSKDEQALADLERRFLDLDAPAEAPERGELWLEMARLNTGLSRQRDAGLCWTRALWEAEGQRERVVAQHWSVAEAMLQGDRSGGDARLLDRLLATAEPAPQQVRAVASLLVRASLSEGTLDPERLYNMQVWLDANDRGLDVRSLWLAHLSLSRMAGGDALQLTRTRDRILGRLFRGMSVEQDVPTFLRFCGGGPGADTTTVGHLTAQLEDLLKRFGKTKRKRSAVEAPEKLTGAYVQLLFACGFARLGQSERARELRDAAGGELPRGEPIHDFLRQAYLRRVEHALEGLPAETPLPSELSGQLNQLERFVRYKVDRLRQASFVLEPHERLDPVLAFQQAKSDPRGEELAPMRGMTDPDQLSRAVAQVMTTAIAPDTAIKDRDRLFDGVMDFFPMLAESESVPHLRTLVDNVEPIQLARRCMLLEEALMLSGFFGRGDMVQELVERLKLLIGELGTEHVTEVASTLGQCLRSMRRVGLADEAGELLTAVASAVKGGGTPVMVARLQLAAGLADMGRIDQAQAMLQEGSKALKDKSLLLVDRLELTRAMASAASHLPQAQALAELQRLGTQLPLISDSFNTNSHFCLSVIQFMESLILGYASEQLALGQLGRRWLDEDEYLVRRRIHRDLAQEQQ